MKNREETTGILRFHVSAPRKSIKPTDLIELAFTALWGYTKLTCETLLVQEK